MSREYIAIRKSKISGDKRISVDLSCSKGVRKYLLSDRLYAEYDTQISEVNPSILQIPAVNGRRQAGEGNRRFLWVFWQYFREVIKLTYRIRIKADVSRD